MPITPASQAAPAPFDPDEITLQCAPIVRGALAPEFEQYYLDLEDLYEEDLTDDIVLNELADFFSDLIASGGPEPLIERCCDAFEAICNDVQIDSVTTLYDQVLLALSARTLERARPYFGPETETLLTALESEPAKR